MKRNSLQFVFILSAFILLAGCGARKDMQIAEAGVTRIHAQMDAEQYGDMYAQADDAFRAASKQQDFLDLMSAIHRKLGRVQSASETRYFVNFTTSGTQVRLNYHTKFEGGEGDEEFLWHVSGEQALLLGYHINSNALILK
jgi:Protein of unknown function (DUF4019)